MVGFDIGFGSYDVYISISLLVYYIDDVFNHVFSDTPSGGYGIYIIICRIWMDVCKGRIK